MFVGIVGVLSRVTATPFILHTELRIRARNRVQIQNDKAIVTGQ